MTIARKLFSRTVSITGGAAISLGNLMRSASAVTGSSAWGLESNGITPSMDSFQGNAGTVIPLTAIVYFGYDSHVADTDAATTYKGVPAAANVPFSLASFCRGIVDADAIWIYSASTQDMNIVFEGF